MTEIRLKVNTYVSILIRILDRTIVIHLMATKAGKTRVLGGKKGIFNVPIEVGLVSALETFLTEKIDLIIEYSSMRENTKKGT